MANQAHILAVADRIWPVVVVNVGFSLPRYVRRVNFRILAITLGLAFFLGGCTNLWQAGIDAMRAVQPQTIHPSQLHLDPNLQYLKVTVNRQELLMVLGYHFDDQQVWFSSDRAVLKTKKGYLLDLDGFEVNWHNIQGPDLATVLLLKKPTAYTRVRDQSPGYRVQIRESVLLTPLDGPPRDAPAGLMQQQSLRWFKEEVRSRYAEQLSAEPLPGFFAVDTSQKPIRIVYGKQCLRMDYCIQWHTFEPKRAGF
jgi:hypothetical protein